MQAARNAGATVVGVAGGAAKVQRVAQLGATVAVDYSAPDWSDAVREALDGRAVTVALDGVGGALGRGALELLGAGGRLILFGFSSGEPTELSAGDLFSRGITASAAIGARIAQRPGGLRDLEERALAAAADGRARPARAALRARAGRRRAHGDREPRHRGQDRARAVSAIRRSAGGREYGQHQYGSPAAPPAWLGRCRPTFPSEPSTPPIVVAPPRASATSGCGGGRRGPLARSYRAAYVEATGELYVMQHEGMRGGGQVQVLGRFDSFAELHRLVAGWEDVCGEPGSIDWLLARVGRVLPTPPDARIRRRRGPARVPCRSR